MRCYRTVVLRTDGPGVRRRGIAFSGDTLFNLFFFAITILLTLEGYVYPQRAREIYHLNYMLMGGVLSGHRVLLSEEVGQKVEPLIRVLYPVIQGHVSTIEDTRDCTVDAFPRC